MFNWLLFAKIFLTISLSLILIVLILFLIVFVRRLGRDEPSSFCMKHIKGDPMMFAYRMNIVTGEKEALYHCKKCQEIMHFPLSSNPKEKELHDKRQKETKNFTKNIKNES